MDQPVSALGGDSLDMVDMLFETEREFGVRLPYEEDGLGGLTLGQVAEDVRRSQAADARVIPFRRVDKAS